MRTTMTALFGGLAPTLAARQVDAPEPGASAAIVSWDDAYELS